MSVCAKCKFAALCLNGGFKDGVVRCTVCGHFRWVGIKVEYYKDMDIDVPPCLHIPKLSKHVCHFCKQGWHYKVRYVWPSEPEKVWIRSLPPGVALGDLLHKYIKKLQWVSIKL